MLTPSQIEILTRSDLYDSESDKRVIDVLQQPANSLTDTELLEFIEVANALYRAGDPVITDLVYDSVYLGELTRRQPDHPYLHTVETEAAFTGKTIALPAKMLSTEKAYSKESIVKWLDRVEKSAGECRINYQTLIIKATPKLDGFAAYDDGSRFYTRGDGRKGTDISRVFSRGLTVAGDGQRGQGAGEIVVNKDYFAQHLAEHFENARNFQASIIKEKELEQHALDAIEKKAAVFFPFAQLPAWLGTAKELLADFEAIENQVLTRVIYDVDGVIFEATEDVLKQHMGATRHHHRWQIALKSNTETAEVKVLRVTAQTSRSGRINPVAELEPTYLSGATISRATAHHYGMVRELGIGPGTIIELTRSGLVIPKIERVITPMETQIPKFCPSCCSELVWDNDYLFCLNTSHCPAQIEHSIEHFFKTLANVDGFGRKTITKLHQAGIDSVLQVYRLDMAQLQAMGFGDKTAQNLLHQLQRSKTEAIEDWRFLGAFGIHRMGLGNCERLLMHYPLSDIFTLSVEDLIDIEGFADKTATNVAMSLNKIKEDFNAIYQLGFNLNITPLVTDISNMMEVSPVFGKTIVFTGAMKHGSRQDMKKQAKRLGAKTASTVTGKTDYLVVGEKVGASKIAAAREKGIKVITEEEYMGLLEN